MNKQRNFVHCSLNYQTTANKLGVANNANIVIKSTLDEQTTMLQAGVRSRVDFAVKSELFQFQPNTGICSIFCVFRLYQRNLQPSVSSSQVHELITLPQAPCFMFFCPTPSATTYGQRPNVFMAERSATAEGENWAYGPTLGSTSGQWSVMWDEQKKAYHYQIPSLNQNSV